MTSIARSPREAGAASAGRVRPRLLLGLALAALLSAWAALSPPEQGQPVPSLASRQQTQNAVLSVDNPPPAGPLPARAASHSLATSSGPAGRLAGAQDFDPFVGMPIEPVVPPQPVVAAPVLAPEPLPPPPVEYRFLGRIKTPTGQTVTLLNRGDHTVVAEPGRELPTGYLIEQVDAEAVHLSFSATGAKAVIAIPPQEPGTTRASLRSDLR